MTRPLLFDTRDQDEVPAFLADRAYGKNVATGKPYFEPPLTDKNAVYSIWIGVNDLGVFYDQAQENGTTAVDYIDCVWTQLDRLYAAGGRYFVVMDVPPLYLVPLYANASEGGVRANQYAPERQADFNQTASAIKMHEYVESMNAIYKYKTPFEAVLNGRYPGAHFALYDVGRLVSIPPSFHPPLVTNDTDVRGKFVDIHQKPSMYLNGTAPLNTTGYIHHCDLKGTNCTYQDSRDSYEWYDELHPSEQVQRLVAKNFVDVLKGKSNYVTYFDAPK